MERRFKNAISLPAKYAFRQQEKLAIFSRIYWHNNHMLALARHDRYSCSASGRLAQLAERHLYTVDAAGSSPAPPITNASRPVRVHSSEFLTHFSRCAKSEVCSWM